MGRRMPSDLKRHFRWAAEIFARRHRTRIDSTQQKIAQSPCAICSFRLLFNCSSRTDKGEKAGLDR